MPVTADAIRLNLGPRDEIIHRSPHIEDVFPGQTLTRDDIPQELKPLKGWAVELLFGVLPLTKTESIRTDHDISEFGERDSGEVHRVAIEPCGFGFADGPATGMLVPDAHCWSG